MYKHALARLREKMAVDGKTRACSHMHKHTDPPTTTLPPTPHLSPQTGKTDILTEIHACSYTTQSHSLANLDASDVTRLAGPANAQTKSAIDQPTQWLGWVVLGSQQPALNRRDICCESAWLEGGNHPRNPNQTPRLGKSVQDGH